MDCGLYQAQLMNRIITAVLLTLVVSATCHAQSRAALRDSLTAAEHKLAQHPDSVDLILRKASWYVLLEQWESAKTEYDQALHYQPANPAALYYRAFVNTKLGRYSFARMDYTNLLVIVPGNFEAQLGLALLNDKDKHHTEAMDQLNRLVEAFPDSAVAYAARAGAELERGQHMLAEYDYTQAIQRDPANADYILGRAESLISQGKKQEARRDLDILVTLGLPRKQLEPYYERIKE